MGAADKGSIPREPSGSLRDMLNAYTWMLVWICLSISIILVNKHVIFYSGFHFPISLAFWHMFLATVTARLSVWALDLPDAISQAKSTNLYMQVALTGLLFGGTLVAGNAALMFLSVPTIQMLKVGHPTGQSCCTACMHCGWILLGHTRLGCLVVYMPAAARHLSTTAAHGSMQFLHLCCAAAATLAAAAAPTSCSAHSGVVAPCCRRSTR